MQLTIGNKIEAWALQALRAAATLPFDLQAEAYNSSADAKTERLVVKAEVGERLLEGEKPYNVNLEVSFHTVNRNAEQANDVFAKVEAVLFTPGPSSYVDAHFTWLVPFTENARTTLDSSGNFRRYVRTIPLQALTI